MYMPPRSKLKSRAARKRKINRRKGRGKGFSNKIYTYNFKLASQTLLSSTTAGPGVPPISLNAPVAGGVFQPFTGPGPSYSSQIQLLASSLGLGSMNDLSIGTGFRLNMANYYNTYASLYDHYRINHVTCTVEKLFPNETSGAAGTVQRPVSTLYQYRDLDSVAPPATLQSISGFQGVRVTQFNTNKGITSFRLYPRVNVGLQSYNATGTPLIASGIVDKPMWLDSVNSDVEHFGWKCFITNWLATGSVAQMTGYRFTFTMNVSFKQPIQAA